MTMNSNNHTTPDTTCTHPANDLIEAVAFGFASADEQRLVLEHVTTCAECAAALADARFAAQVLPLTLAEMDVPESVWSGIEQRIDAADVAEETEFVSPVTSVKRAPFKLHWALAAMLAVLTLIAGIFLGRTVFESESDTDETLQVAVSITDPEINATGSVNYFTDQGVLVLDLETLPSAPEGYVYQVWMIEGDTPVSMGLFDPSSDRWAVAADPAEFDLLAITVEEGPDGNDQPTTDPLVVADLEPLRGD